MSVTLSYASLAAIASVSFGLFSWASPTPVFNCACPQCSPALTCSGNPSAAGSSVTVLPLWGFASGVLISIAAVVIFLVVRSSSPGLVEESKGSKGGRGTIRSLPIIA